MLYLSSFIRDTGNVLIFHHEESSDQYWYKVRHNNFYLSLITAVQSKNAVCAFIKHSRYFDLTYTFTSIHSHAKKLYLPMLQQTYDIVDTAFSYEIELIVCSFLPDYSKGKGSSVQLICNAHASFLLCGAEQAVYIKTGHC